MSGNTDTFEISVEASEHLVRTNESRKRTLEECVKNLLCLSTIELNKFADNAERKAKSVWG